jgi:tRNA (guanosine-2'-O-)-methyltransferase
MTAALATSLDDETLARIEGTLLPLLTDERIQRLDAALATRSRDVVLVLEDLLNEHNGAAVLRTAEAFGFFEVHVMEPELGRFKVNQKISKGTQKWLQLHHHTTTAATFEALRARGYAVWVSTLHGQAVDVHEVPVDRPVALVFGNELTGVSAEAVARADGYFRIPMTGFVESFNISVAAAISLYDLSLRLKARGGPSPLAPEDRRRVRASWLARAAKSGPDVLARAGLPVPVLHAEELSGHLGEPEA